MPRLAAIWIVFLSLSPLALQSKAKPRIWQDGEVTSRKTIHAASRLKREYLYGVRSDGVRYLVVLDRPLSLELYAPVKFSVGRRHLIIHDADGQERKARVLEKNAGLTLRR
jgi:hypothetical protein